DRRGGAALGGLGRGGLRPGACIGAVGEDRHARGEEPGGHHEREQCRDGGFAPQGGDGAAKHGLFLLCSVAVTRCVRHGREIRGRGAAPKGESDEMRKRRGETPPGARRATWPGTSEPTIIAPRLAITPASCGGTAASA